MRHGDVAAMNAGYRMRQIVDSLRMAGARNAARSDILERAKVTQLVEEGRSLVATWSADTALHRVAEELTDVIITVLVKGW